MWKNEKVTFTSNSIIVFSTFANAAIITAAFIYTPGMLWLLFFTIPLLMVGIFNGIETSRLQVLNRINAGPVLKKPRQPRIPYSIYPVRPGSIDLKVRIGNESCGQAYDANIFNVSSLRNNYPSRIHEAAGNDNHPDNFRSPDDEKFRIYRLTGEDLVLQIKSYYSYTKNGNEGLNFPALQLNAGRAEVKLIELILPSGIESKKKKNSSADTKDGLNGNVNCRSYLYSEDHMSDSAEGMIHFLDYLRELSGQKPTGLRLSIRNKKEFRGICHAIRKTQLIPDFIVVEGSSFETIAPVQKEKDPYTIMPLYEALLFVSQTLQAHGLEKEVKVIASAKIDCCFDILKVLALGASAVFAKPSSYSVNSHETSFFQKSQEIMDFQNSMLKATVQAMEACGCRSIHEITLPKLFRRLDELHSEEFTKSSLPLFFPGTIKTISNSRSNFSMQ